MSEAVRTHLVLVGLMGSGKTTVAKLLAERLGRPLVDTDATIEASTGRTVREIWLADGEPAYRKLESAVLTDALAESQASVIAAAGGVVLAAENRAALRASDAVVVWLDGDAGVLAVRAANGTHRPLLDDDPATTLHQMATDREALYAEVADHTVDVTSAAPDAVASHIAALVERAVDL